MEVPTKSPPHIERARQAFPITRSVSLLVRKLALFAQRQTFEVGVAETPLHWARFYVPLDADLIKLRCSRLSGPGAPAFHRSSDATLNGEAGNSTGFRAQLLFFLDDLIPKPFDKPLLSDKPDRSLIAWH